MVIIRARNRCECVGECGKHNPPERCGRMNGETIEVPEEDMFFQIGMPIDPNLFQMAYREWSPERDRYIERIDPRTFTKVVLTVAHLDHTPENCHPNNLKAMCQRCHLAYDAQHHAQTRYETRRVGKVSHDLFALTQPTPAPSAGPLLGAPRDPSKQSPALPMLQESQRSTDRTDSDQED
jgi:hypothetical protein